MCIGFVCTPEELEFVTVARVREVDRREGTEMGAASVLRNADEDAALKLGARESATLVTREYSAPTRNI